jgi:Kinesin motor domain
LLLFEAAGFGLHIAACICNPHVYLQDLLQPKSTDLQLRESPEEGVYVAGLKEVLVTRLEDCLELLKLGERNRHVTACIV